MQIESRYHHILLLILSLCLLSATVQAENWTRFRGENGAGMSDEAGIPVTWSPGDYAWDIKLPGMGHSSPIVYGKSLFITSAVDDGAVRMLFCLDAVTGEQRWMSSVGMNKSHKHAKGSWASSTPTTDGKKVYVAFSDEERCFLSAYDFDGQLIWRRVLGAFPSQHGHGVSPILFQNMVILPSDKLGPSWVIAVNAESGKTIWSQLRHVRRTSYATPFVLNRAGKSAQLICTSGAMGITSLNPFTGVMNWHSGEFPSRTVASPVYAKGMIIQTCGGGGRGKLLIGVDPDSQGLIPLADFKLQIEKNLPYVPTPIYYNDHLYLWCDNGVVSCVELPGGKIVWTKRVGGKYSGSPVCIDGKLYAVSEAGEVVVLAASPQYQLLGRTSIGETSHTTPVVANGRLYLKSFHRLKCLESKQTR